MSGVLRLSNSVTGRSTIIASASNDQTFTLPALGGTLLAGGSSLEVIFPSGSEALPGLHVQGDTDTGLYAPAANTLGISTAGSERLRIDSSGNVGIGNTAMSALADNDANDLVVGPGNANAGITVYTGTGNYGSLTFADGTSGDQDYRGSVVYHHSGDSMRFNTAASERLRIDSSGRLLVGTTTGAYKFVVSGGVATTGIVASILNPVSGGNSKIHFSDNATYNWTAGTVGNAFAITPAEASSSAGTPALFINSSGDVGIGTSSPGGYKLHVAGNVLIGQANSLLFGSSSGPAPKITNSGQENSLSFFTNGSESARIDSSGNVGIGTTSPVNSANFNTLQLGNGTSTGGQIALKNTTNQDFYLWHDGNGVNIYNQSATSQIFYNGAAERMRINSSGNVGIGTSNPGNLIEAKGTDAGVAVHFSGNCYGGIAALSSGRLALVTGNINDDIVFGYSDYALSSGSFVQRMKINNGSGTVNITGALSKGSGSFKISHPLPSKTDTHNLVHSFIEGPQADLIYRGYVDLVDGQATVNIDTAARMTEGTFEVLCTNVSCFTSNESDWTAVKGSVTGNILTITAQDATSTSKVSWMVVGERKDPHMLETNWTDENGRVITEPLKNED